MSIEHGAWLETNVAHPARRYNYWLGGKDHFHADRESGDAIAAAFPTVRLAALENRAFMRRAVAHLVRDLGVRQFLDIGTGIPAPDSTHQVAQALAPESRVVYVDHDPIVMAHARALLTSAPSGRTAYIEADLRDYRTILAAPGLRSTLDLARPVALMLVAILHFLHDTDDPHQVVARLVDELPPGSYLVISHATADFAEVTASGQAPTTIPRTTVWTRSKDEVMRFLSGLEPIDPGVVPVADWRADSEPQPRPSAADVPIYGAVARVP